MSKMKTDKPEQYLAKIIECEEKQDSSIEHEFIFNAKKEAVQIANYLRGHGYKTTFKEYHPLGITVYYVGVEFKNIKTKIV